MKSLMKNKKLLNAIGLIVFFGYFAVGIIISLIREQKLQIGPSAYTIAVITDVESGAKVSPWFDYHYKVNNKVYFGMYSITDKMRRYPWEKLEKYIGKRFYVKFYIPDPDNNELLIYKPVPCELDSAPLHGWKKIPEVGPLPYCPHEKYVTAEDLMLKDLTMVKATLVIVIFIILIIIYIFVKNLRKK